MKNLNVLWTIDDIYIQSQDKIQGGLEIFDIHSHRGITRQKNIEITITKEIIKHID